MRKTLFGFALVITFIFLVACRNEDSNPIPSETDGDQIEEIDAADSDEVVGEQESDSALDADSEFLDGDTEAEPDTEEADADTDAEPEADSESEAEIPLLCGVPKTPSPVIDETATWSAGESPTWVTRSILDGAEFQPCDPSVTKDSPNFALAFAITGDAQGAVWFANAYGLWKYTKTPTPLVSCVIKPEHDAILLAIGAEPDEIWLATGHTVSDGHSVSKIAHYKNGALLYEDLPETLVRRDSNGAIFDGQALAMAVKGSSLAVQTTQGIGIWQPGGEWQVITSCCSSGLALPGEPMTPFMGNTPLRDHLHSAQKFSGLRWKGEELVVGGEGVLWSFSPSTEICTPLCQFTSDPQSGSERQVVVSGLGESGVWAIAVHFSAASTETILAYERSEIGFCADSGEWHRRGGDDELIIASSTARNTIWLGGTFSGYTKTTCPDMECVEEGFYLGAFALPSRMGNLFDFEHSYESTLGGSLTPYLGGFGPSPALYLGETDGVIGDLLVEFHFSQE